MKTEQMRHKNHLFHRAPWLCIAVLLHVTLIHSQSLPPQAKQSTQEQINNRIAQIIAHDLRQGVSTTDSGVRVTRMRADMSLEELNEIKQYGDRAISPLSEYLRSPDYRAQHLAVQTLGYIGGKSVVKPLSFAAQESPSGAVRLAAVANLTQHPWQDVAEVIQRVAANDSDPTVKKEAQAIIAKNQPAP